MSKRWLFRQTAAAAWALPLVAAGGGARRAGWGRGFVTLRRLSASASAGAGRGGGRRASAPFVPRSPPCLFPAFSPPAPAPSFAACRPSLHFAPAPAYPPHLSPARPACSPTAPRAPTRPRLVAKWSVFVRSFFPIPKSALKIMDLEGRAVGVACQGRRSQSSQTFGR